MLKPCQAPLQIVSFYYYAGVTTAKRQPLSGGIQVLAWLNDKTLATAAQAAGPGVRALSEWDAGTRQQNGLLMGFTNFTSVEEAQAAVKRLAALLKINARPAVQAALLAEASQ